MKRWLFNITAALSLPAAKYDQPAKNIAFADATLARLRGLPGVTAAGITDVLPFTGSLGQWTVDFAALQDKRSTLICGGRAMPD